MNHNENKGKRDASFVQTRTFIQGVEITSPNIQCTECQHEIKLDQKQIKRSTRANFVHTVINNDSSCMFYTGIATIQLLFFIFNCVKPIAEKVKLWGSRKSNNKYGRKRMVLTLFEEFLLTLVRIRRGYCLDHIAHLFGTTESYSSIPFYTWIIFLQGA